LPALEVLLPELERRLRQDGSEKVGEALTVPLKSPPCQVPGVKYIDIV
jgi:hypothetical protein